MTVQTSAGKRHAAGGGKGKASPAAAATRRVEHGTRARYTKGCRCRPCRDANNDYNREWRARQSGPVTAEHGSRSAYEAGCRCEPCTEANRAYFADYRRRNRARINKQWHASQGGEEMCSAQAARSLVVWLLDQGASIPWIAAQTGLTHMPLYALRRGEQDRVRRRTLRLLDALARRVAAGEVHTPRIRSSVPDRPCLSCGQRERDGKHSRCSRCMYRSRVADAQQEGTAA